MYVCMYVCMYVSFRVVNIQVKAIYEFAFLQFFILLYKRGLHLKGTTMAS